MDNVSSGQGLLKGLFQISENPTSVKIKDQFGYMKVTSVSGNMITMSNNGSIGLDKGKNDVLMGNIKLRVADDDSLRFFFAIDVMVAATPSITGVTISPTTLFAGNEINLTIGINNPGASFNGRVEGNVWAPDGTGKYLGWENVVIPSGASTVTIIGPAGGEESSYITHQAGTHLYDVFLENVDDGQVYLNPTDSKKGVPFSVGAAANVYLSNVTLSASPTDGSLMTLNVTISNPTASAFTGIMDANIWDSARGYALTPQTINITAGGSTTLTFSYTPVNHGLHSYDFFMVSAVSGQNTKAPWGFPCMDYVAGIGFNVV